MLGWNPLVTGAYPFETSDRDYTAVMGGTSGACPQVAGIAALVLARQHSAIDYYNPAPKVREIITESAVDILAYGWDVESAYGRADAYRALLSIIHGDVNNDGEINDLDLGLEIDILFSGAHAVLDDLTADFDCDGFRTALDLGKMIDYLFAGGAAPPICFNYYQ